jgi:hypothetical protein
MGRGQSQKNLDLVQLANEILEEIHPASVRAVCYQLWTGPPVRGDPGRRGAGPPQRSYLRAWRKPGRLTPRGGLNV